MVRRLLAVLVAGGLAVSGQAQAQAEAPAAGSAVPTSVDPVTILGRRLSADQQRARCEEIMKDPHARALMAAGASTLIGRTRPPRNPDYSAPPLVALDAPLPEVQADETAIPFASEGGADTDPGAAAAEAQAMTLAAAVAACAPMGRSRRVGGSGGGTFNGEARSAAFWSRLTGGSLINPSFGEYRDPGSYRAGSRGRTKPDTTLPLALALFDQGRYELALDAFKVAHKTLGDVDGGDEAALMIGKIYLHALGPRSDPLEAVTWLKWASASYFNPRYHTQPFNPQRPEYTTAIGEASMILAGLYAEGHGPIARDPAQARKYLERAVQTGYVPASKDLGDIYYEGRDTPRDVRKAFRHYMDAATYAYAPAAVAVAKMYAQGEAPGGVDLVKAAAWNNEAAKFEDNDALYAMAVAYDHGEGVAADPERALGFYKIAAVNGHAAAQGAIGTYFYKGEQVPQDLEVARGWFEQAALAADPDGMFNFAAMLARGEGGEADRVRAWGWLKIADQAGHPQAAEAARALEARFTAEDRAGVEALTASLERPPASAPGADPDREIDPAFVGVAPGGPPWWKVSKGGATVWVLGLPTGRALSTQRWNTAPFRGVLDDARLVIAPYSPWSRIEIDNTPFNELPGPLGDKLTAAAVRLRQPLRNRRPTLSDAVRTHTVFYRAGRLSDTPPLDLHMLAYRKKVGVITPQKRPGPKLVALPTGGADVAACVEAILADIAIPAEQSKAASAAWAAGDVAGALAAPPSVHWACDVLWPNYRERAVGFTTEAIVLALDMPGKVVASADIAQLVARDGILARLRERGLEVSGPMQPTGR